MSRKRVKKRDLKSQLEEIECEIALFTIRKRWGVVKKLKLQLKTLREQFIEENLKYYEQCKSGEK